MKNWLLRSVVMLMLAWNAPVTRANDTAVDGVGGRWQIVGKEHSSVRMVSERVDIHLQHDYQYTTIAEFVFRNEGAATRVKMGFPESGGGDRSILPNQTSFKSFATWVDGQRVSAQRRTTPIGNQEFSALWVKMVPFAKGQTRRVKVRYVSKVGAVSSGLHSFVCYDFTGGNWLGKVAQSVLTVHFDVTSAYLVSVEAMKTLPRFRREGRDFIFSWRDWQAQDSFILDYNTKLVNWLDGHSISPPKFAGFLNGKTVLPVNIEVPGQSQTARYVDELSVGTIRNGQTFVALTDWLFWAKQHKSIKSSYDARTLEFIVRNGKGVMHFSPTKEGSLVVRSGSGERTLFVPISRLQPLGAKFEVRPREHLIRFVS